MVFENLARKPKLIVFDLDLTLWPFDCIDYTYSNLTIRNGKVYDSFNYLVEPFPEAEAVLKRIKEEPDVKIAVASSTAAPRMGREFIELFGWDKYFDYVEIYPTEKTRHFRKLKQDSKISYKDMLFFDDLGFNIHDVSTLGVHCVHVDDGGVDLTLLRSGLESFAQSSS
ncbi:unnamed protein product [Hymenolepis diminuta]|uniref:Magnesium-dependent phosphatase 1 n=1 Tax=Hymenolepis diminuta TaxID=6216 RepID=A0A564Y8D6_HYMDI|nr:unnamed protein product [Hymenolepis diminuta]